MAAVNTPGDTVLSGASEALEPLLVALEADGVRVRRLRVSHAFHSPLMAPIVDAFALIADEGGRTGLERLVVRLYGDLWVRHEVVVPVGVRWTATLRRKDEDALVLFSEDKRSQALQP